MSDTPFKDHFSGASDDYRRNRPTYPDALFAWLASITPERSVAWDCATGTGQAAVALANHFSVVIATDASATQIAAAPPHPAIDYRVAPAEQSGLAGESVDLITVAQALHWFDIPAFFAEAERVLRPHGVLAVWSYNLLTISPSIDAALHHLYHHVLAPYWPPERRMVEKGYRDIDLPFAPLDAPPFAMQAEWNREQLLAYLRTWSAVRRFREVRGYDPVEACSAQLSCGWPEGDERKTVAWPLALYVMRKG